MLSSMLMLQQSAFSMIVTDDEEFVSFEPALKEYRIPKFRRTNQNMVVDLRPICDKGQRVKKGDILTEGYATENGELALGRNLVVAYMPWKGYNYEGCYRYF